MNEQVRGVAAFLRRGGRATPPPLLFGGKSRTHDNPGGLAVGLGAFVTISVFGETVLGAYVPVNRSIFLR